MTRTLAACLALLGLAACATEPEDPIAFQPQAGYYFQGQLIPLTVEPRVLTVETDPPAILLITSALGSAGLTPDSVTELSVEPNHWRVWLPVSTTASASDEGTQRLRQTPGIRFASQGYHTAGAQCTILLLNHFLVGLQPNVSPEAIDVVNQRVGAHRVAGNNITMTYPLNTRHSPLDIVAYYEFQPGVAWAEPDMVPCTLKN